MLLHERMRVSLAPGASGSAAVAAGALALGAIGRVAVGQSRFGQVEIDRLAVRQLSLGTRVIAEPARSTGAAA